MRALALIGEEYRERRTALGLSQLAVASAASIARSRYTRIEAGRVEHLSIVEAARIASVLGLDLSVRLYPGGQPLRDGAHAERLNRIGQRVRSPLRFRTEVALPPRPDAPEQRAGTPRFAAHENARRSSSRCGFATRRLSSEGSG
jgi:transcriptional regulator with XRE-family HTH domain